MVNELEQKAFDEALKEIEAGSNDTVYLFHGTLNGERHGREAKDMSPGLASLADEHGLYLHGRFSLNDKDATLQFYLFLSKQVTLSTEYIQYLISKLPSHPRLSALYPQ